MCQVNPRIPRREYHFNMPNLEQCNACESFQATHYKLYLFETNHKESMNHWESIVNIALCCYKLVSKHKYRHMYKIIKKRVHTSFPCYIPFVDPCHYYLVTCTIERKQYIIKCHHGLELNSENKAN